MTQCSTALGSWPLVCKVDVKVDNSDFEKSFLKMEEKLLKASISSIIEIIKFYFENLY